MTWRNYINLQRKSTLLKTKSYVTCSVLVLCLTESIFLVQIAINYTRPANILCVLHLSVSFDFLFVCDLFVAENATRSICCQMQHTTAVYCHNELSTWSGRTVSVTAKLHQMHSSANGDRVTYFDENTTYRVKNLETKFAPQMQLHVIFTWDKKQVVQLIGSNFIRKLKRN